MSPELKTNSSLGHKPTERWEFDGSVTEVFEDMLSRSIPQLDAMRDLVLQIGTRFVQPGTDIVDLGCARGDAMAQFLQNHRETNRFVGIEVSQPMLAVARNRFESLIESGTVDIREDDLRLIYPDVRASLTLCILTLQFVPLEYRLRVLEDAFKRTVPGGAFVLVEKILGADAQMNTLLVDLYYRHKRAMGYTQEEIDRKRLSLEGVLVPVTASWNEDLLRRAGFSRIECFWRVLNFCGWIATT
jgi:tRNA (cmo5U34)-methyltransferase